MTSSDHRHYRELLGAYVLGHLEDEEERALETHLQRCASCRAEAEDLGEVVAVLSAHPDAHPGFGPTPHTTRTDEETGEHSPLPEPSPELEDRVVATATGGRAGPGTGARRRWLSAPSLAAASVAVIVLVTGAIWAFPSETENPGLGDVEPISFTTEPEGVSADGEVIAHTWGTEVILEMEGLEEGEKYTVEVGRKDGDLVSAGTLIGDSDIPVECSLNGAVLRENADEVSVRDSGGELVLRSNLESRS